jgi:hypothetical protein
MPGNPVVAGQILTSQASLDHFLPQAITWLKTNADKKEFAVTELFVYTNSINPFH